MYTQGILCKDTLVMFANTVCVIIKLELINEKPDTINTDNQSM